jgi:hypothetical protein
VITLVMGLNFLVLLSTSPRRPSPDGVATCARQGPRPVIRWYKLQKNDGTGSGVRDDRWYKLQKNDGTSRDVCDKLLDRFNAVMKRDWVLRAAHCMEWSCKAESEV